LVAILRTPFKRLDCDTRWPAWARNLRWARHNHELWG